MKIGNLLPLLLLLITFTSCIETTTRTVHQDTIPPELSVEEEVLKSRISAIIPAEDIYFTSSYTQISGEEDYNTLNVEIVPETFPSNGFSFAGMADDIQVAVESGIGNMDDYQKMKIEVRRSTDENGTEHKRSFKKEFDL